MTALVYAANKINAAGGVNGRKIELITRDSSGDPAKAVNAAMDLASNQKVHAVFGPVNSGESLATTPIFTRFKIPSLGICVVDGLIDPVKFPNAFRLSPNNTQWDDAVRHYILDIVKAKKVAVLGDNTGYVPSRRKRRSCSCVTRTTRPERLQPVLILSVCWPPCQKIRWWYPMRLTTILSMTRLSLRPSLT